MHPSCFWQFLPTEVKYSLYQFHTEVLITRKMDRYLTPHDKFSSRVSKRLFYFSHSFTVRHPLDQNKKGNSFYAWLYIKVEGMLLIKGLWKYMTGYHSLMRSKKDLEFLVSFFTAIHVHASDLASLPVLLLSLIIKNNVVSPPNSQPHQLNS